MLSDYFASGSKDSSWYNLHLQVGFELRFLRCRCLALILSLDLWLMMLFDWDWSFRVHNLVIWCKFEVSEFCYTLCLPWLFELQSLWSVDDLMIYELYDVLWCVNFKMPLESWSLVKIWACYGSLNIACWADFHACLGFCLEVEDDVLAPSHWSWILFKFCFIQHLLWIYFRGKLIFKILKKFT